MLTVGSVIYGTAIDLDYLGQGVIKHEGYVIFVKGLLTGEYAEIIITSLKKKFAEGKVIKRIKDSKDRAHETHVLGSLDLYHLSLDKQLEWQKKLTKDTLKKIGQLDIDIDDVLTDHEDLYYRNKSAFHVISKDYLSLGLYHNNHDLMEVKHFLLAGKTTNQLLAFIYSNKIKIEKHMVRHVLFRENDLGEVLVTLVVEKKAFFGLDDLISLLSSQEKVIGITLNMKSSDSKILGEKSYTYYGENRIMMPLGDHRISIDDLSFFQVNTKMMHLTYDVIKSWLKPQKRLLDAYAGVGSIGYYVYDFASNVSMIESNPRAHEKAKQYQEEHQLTQVDLYLDQSESAISSIDADILIVDPPRQGLHPHMIAHLNNQVYDQIIYLSCDVKTLARDLNLLKDTYDIKKVLPIRMFFHTTELETLTLLEPKSN